MGVQAKFNGLRNTQDLSENAAALLIQLDRFEQRLEIPLTETVVAFALNDFEEDGADGVLGEYLQKDAALGTAVDENATPLELGHRFAVARDAAIDAFIVSCRGFL